MEKITRERLLDAGWNEKRHINLFDIKEAYQKVGGQ